MSRRRDVLTAAQRSFCMSRNRGRDTSPEVVLRHACWALGLRFRLASKLVGRPDFVFVGPRVAVFVDGCFWHGCPEHYQAPATRAAFWRSKIEANKRRDAVVNAELSAAGWKVLRFWEHQISHAALCDSAARLIRRAVIARATASRSRPPSAATSSGAARRR